MNRQKRRKSNCRVLRSHRTAVSVNRRDDPIWRLYRPKKGEINAKATTMHQSTIRNAKKASVVSFGMSARGEQCQIAAQRDGTSQNGGSRSTNRKREESTSKQRQCNKGPPQMAVQPTEKASDQRQSNRNATINRQKRRKCGCRVLEPLDGSFGYKTRRNAARRQFHRLKKRGINAKATTMQQ
jgi:hypothetical protein